MTISPAPPEGILPENSALQESRDEPGYALRLAREGPAWYMDLQLPKLAAHLHPLARLPGSALPPRVQWLRMMHSILSAYIAFWRCDLAALESL